MILTVGVKLKALFDATVATCYYTLFHLDQWVLVSVMLPNPFIIIFIFNITMVSVPLANFLSQNVMYSSKNLNYYIPSFVSLFCHM